MEVPVDLHIHIHQAVLPLRLGALSSVSESLAHSKRLVPTLSSKPQERWGRTKSSWCPGTTVSPEMSEVAEIWVQDKVLPSPEALTYPGGAQHPLMWGAGVWPRSWEAGGTHSQAELYLLHWACTCSLKGVLFLLSSKWTFSKAVLTPSIIFRQLSDVLSKSQLTMTMPSLLAGHLDSPALQCLLPYPNLRGWGGVYTPLPLERKEASGGATPVQERCWGRGLSLFYRNTVCCKSAFQLLPSKSINLSLHFSIYKMIGGRKLNERYYLLKPSSSKKSKAGDRKGKIKLDPPFEISKRFLTWLFNKCFSRAYYAPVCV